MLGPFPKKKGQSWQGGGRWGEKEKGEEGHFYTCTLHCVDGFLGARRGSCCLSVG